MSYTSVYELYKTKVNCIKELGNGWGSAPVVWDFFEAEYLPKQEFSRMIMNQLDEVWALCDRPDIPEHHRFALMATFDHAYCETARLKEGSEMLSKFADDIESFAKERVNHWPAIAGLYLEAAQSPDHRMLGVCIGHTSVSDPWRDYGAFNGKAWGIFSELYELKAA